MTYQTYCLKSGLRVVFMPATSKIVYCGIVIDAGSRNENEEQHGMAHFVEHLLFKGTEKRSATQIINHLENVGGELNAFTAKEETVIYAAVLPQYTEKAINLIADVTLHSIFDEKQFNREREVVLDEIDSYEDSPSELIFDDFEKELFLDNQALGHFILGEKALLQKYTRNNVFDFYKQNYKPQNMVLFVRGDVDFKKIIKWGEKYFDCFEDFNPAPTKILNPAKINIKPTRKILQKNTTQTHVAIGGSAINMYDSNRIAVSLLNNILGGTGMSCLLNLSLRERHGLVYTVDSHFQPFTDAGQWCVYFGCDPHDADKCEELVYRELRKLREKAFSDNVLAKYKRQFFGQMAISSENSENMAISLGKSYLRFGKVEDLPKIWAKIEAVQPEQLLEIANTMFDTNNICVLKYVP